MGEKGQKPSPHSPLISDSIWSTNESIKDWKTVGNASLGRARARSIVGDVQLAASILDPLKQRGQQEPQEEKKRSMSTSAISGLALRLGFEENEEQYKLLYQTLKEGASPHPERVKVEKDTLSSLRRHSLDPVILQDSSKGEIANEAQIEVNDKNPADKICIVQFGSGRRCFGVYKGFALTKGAFVIIAADRGEDCGAVILGLSSEKSLYETAYKHGVGSVEPKKIFRIATEQDKLMLLEQNELEIEAFNTCKEKVEIKKLMMDIVGAEYQWDRNKLTFYFRSNERVDFRELVKELYKMYKTRIWMCAVEKKIEKFVDKPDKKNKRGSK